MDGNNYLTAGQIMISISILAVILGIVFYNRQQKQTSAPDFAAHVPELLDILLVLIRAGHGPAAAVSQLHHWAPDDLYKPLMQAHTQLVAGTRFAEVMKTLRNQLGPCVYPLCDILVSADRDGLPMTSVLDQLAYHSHLERRRLQDVTARQLPVRLLFPLTCCILPSFVLLAMVPLLVNSLTVVSGQLF